MTTETKLFAVMTCELCHNAAVQHGVLIDGTLVSRICGACRYGDAILPERAVFVRLCADGEPRLDTTGQTGAELEVTG